MRYLTRRFFAAIPSDLTNDAARYKFRIRGKGLRYALELLGGAFPLHLQTELYPKLEDMQDGLRKPKVMLE